MSKPLSALPDPQDMAEARESSRTLSKYAKFERLQVSIKGENGVTDDLILPGCAFQLLLDILAQVSRGNAVSIVPIHAELNTREAADILNVSHPFLVSLLNDGTIPYHKAGVHRRIPAQDLLAYKQEIKKKRGESLDELTSISQKLGMGYE